MYIACHECDLLEAVPPLAERARARCSRCGAVLYRHKVNSVERTLAMAVAGVVLFVVANVYPFLGFELQGKVIESTLLEGVRLLYDDGSWAIAGVVFLTCVLAPMLQLGTLIYVFAPLYLNRHPWDLHHVFRWIQRLQPWSMLEVFMLGILVSVVKLAKMATIVPGIALWSYAILIVVLAGAVSVMDPAEVWKRLEQDK